VPVKVFSTPVIPPISEGLPDILVIELSALLAFKLLIPIGLAP
jgi:hypothetical protein